MSNYDNTNRGVLFENDRKEADTHPDLKGSININGVDHWFSGWWKDGRNGGQFLSVSIGKPKDDQPQQQQPQRQAQDNRPPLRPGQRPAQPQRPQQRQPARSGGGSGFDNMDDDIPY